MFYSYVFYKKLFFYFIFSFFNFYCLLNKFFLYAIITSYILLTSFLILVIKLIVVIIIMKSRINLSKFIFLYSSNYLLNKKNIFLNLFSSYQGLNLFFAIVIK